MSTDAGAPRFLLIDHSITGEGGHHLEYARHVLAAAERRGFTPLLATHERFQPAQLPWQLHRAYERDMWGQLRDAADSSGSVGALRVADIAAKHRNVPFIIWLGRLLLRWDSHRQRKEAFARTTRSLLRRLLLGPTDIVFIPTLSESDFVGLSTVLKTERESVGPSWHVVFRRDIYPDGPSPDQDDKRNKRVRRAILRSSLRSIRRHCPDHRIYYYTDTERLTDQYRRLGSRFSTLPIPVNGTFRPRSDIPTARPVEAVFLGDARREKGYLMLPSIVEALADQLDAGRLHFTIQSNNVSHGGPPEPLVESARAALRAHRSNAVHVHERPMSSDDYGRLVLSADVMLIPYDPDRYRARSSGVLAEALSVGVPVVVPASTWMAEQIQPEDVAYHDDLHSRIANRPICNHQTLPAGAASTFVAAVHPPDTHVLVQVRCERTVVSGTQIRLGLRMLDAFGSCVREEAASMAPRGDGRASALFQIPPLTARVEVAIARADVSRYCGLWCLAAAPGQSPCVSAVGRTYTGVSDAVNALREIVTHYEEYRDRSSAFASKWAQRHNPDRLVAELLMQHAAAPVDARAKPVRVGRPVA
jgi:glycosyltransferase involved in cell wall biosynthesis